MNIKLLVLVSFFCFSISTMDTGLKRREVSGKKQPAPQDTKRTSPKFLSALAPAQGVAFSEMVKQHKKQQPASSADSLYPDTLLQIITILVDKIRRIENQIAQPGEIITPSEKVSPPLSFGSAILKIPKNPLYRTSSLDSSEIPPGHQDLASLLQQLQDLKGFTTQEQSSRLIRIETLIEALQQKHRTEHASSRLCYEVVAISCIGILVQVCTWLILNWATLHSCAS